MNKPYVLSVEDNSVDITLMKRVFSQKIKDVDIVFRKDTDVALDFLNEKFLEQNLPIIILLDIKLIKGNGLDLLKTIKEDKRFSYISVLMLSSSDRLDDKTVARDRGCDEYIEKPRSYTGLKDELPKIIEFWSKKTSNDTRKN